eukprot:TRINITY_DN32245_c0_g1_i2.p1 TRINITY_DN32245_c0_g1~~TRINITY_DN32245_c0_g1_i2.p1  ORF type:complete len:497 (-),score=117.79 TRINITY_DN32245_c0_g1_i2:218-1708(-)
MAPGVLSSLLAFAALADPASATLLRQEILLSRIHKEAPLVEAELNSASYYEDQTLDHFGAGNARTSWKQRYYANFDFYKPGGPVFLYIGGEGPLTATSVTGRTVNFEFAKRMNGATVALEHRFYGASQPFDSLETEHLTYLTSRQALHDLAQFQKWFTKQHSLESSKFFCMGGSYPGNLAAWYRLTFPELTAGCWAASGPVHAVEDWPGFGEMVWKAMSTNYLGAVDAAPAVKLFAGYEQLAALIQDPDAQSVAEDDRDSWESAITTYPGVIMQYNNTAEPHLATLKKIVDEAADPLDAALKVTGFLNVTAANTPEGCADLSIAATYKQLSNATLPEDGSGNAGRTWTWQTCNEFGYFQTARAVLGKPNFYTRGASNRALWQQVCGQVFGMPDGAVGANIAATNDHYGGKDPKGISHVFFSNGALDAWSLLSVTSYPENNRSVESMVAPLGSHCVGLYAPAADELPGARMVREKAFALFTTWMNETTASADASVYV